ncbi:MAG: hypothetical protein ABSD59_25230 [Terracidiphilus sp.]
MKKGIIVTFGALAFLAGCNNQSPKIVIPPKWPGAAYHLSFGPAPAKANAAGLTIPPIKYVANPDAVETRADLVIEFDSSTAKGAPKSDGPVTNQMAMGAVDISGTEGQLPTDYVDKASTDLSKMLGAYCMKGKIKISVALTRSSIPMNPTDDQINAKRLSDWTPIELDFKNPHPKC